MTKTHLTPKRCNQFYHIDNIYLIFVQNYIKDDDYIFIMFRLNYET